MRQKRSMTTGQHNHIETLWQEAGGNSKLFQEEVLDSGEISVVRSCLATRLDFVYTLYILTI